MFDVVGVRTFQEWIRYRYGVFSEVGFPNDPMYPAYYSLGLETLKNDFDYSNLVPTHPLFDTCSTNKLLKWK